nr:MAG TPA: hypothetical protein [Caudoviricetes sp.]
MNLLKISRRLSSTKISKIRTGDPCPYFLSAHINDIL